MALESVTESLSKSDKSTFATAIAPATALVVLISLFILVCESTQ